ncbi:DASS family sodium-coupled anion symporter [Pectinatus haikarae]|uniref:Anion transporter n=1 Tax=Pectinatus haikarae TaxID=349096 RepID=A0ABT9Y895_9FIRM|nr:DASS family sodium-coupled anion symporter [Pectinatus haikarae]MDQ0204032.1 anion transporter [Pectinatus haikarae]
MGKKYGLILSILVLLIIIMLPTPEGLSVSGQRMLGILVFSVIIWMTEAVAYSVSSVLIVSLMALLLGLAPDPVHPEKLLGTAEALKYALSGFSTSALALVGGAMFIAVAMVKTKLDARIALMILSKIGTKTNRVLIGVIAVGFILSFFVPSTTARVSCMVPIILGIINSFGVSMKSRFAAVMMIAVAQADSIWNVGIKTAAAQNMIALTFIEKQLGYYISWGEWFIAAAPFAAIMSVVLYFILLKMIPPETDEIAGGKEAVAKALKELGPMSVAEKKLMIISVILLFLWATEKIVHPLDTTTTTLSAITIMLLPKIGIMDWKYVQNRVSWGTLMLFGTGISLGSTILSTKAADWVASYIVGKFDLYTMSAFGILAVLSIFLIVIHLGFASATALSAAMIPIIISVLQGASQYNSLNIVGMTMVLQYVICFGFILPVNAPQNMIVFSTETVTARDFIRTGIPITIAAYLLILLMAATYWKWLGIVL